MNADNDQLILEREEKRAAFRRDAMIAWSEYQRSGVHVGAEDVIKWLETWGDDDEQSAPQCHK